jgi:hypothetical protein
VLGNGGMVEDKGRHVENLKPPYCKMFYLNSKQMDIILPRVIYVSVWMIKITDTRGSP